MTTLHRIVLACAYLLCFGRCRFVNGSKAVPPTSSTTRSVHASNASTAATPGATCLPGWLEYKSHCYKVQESFEDWFKALSSCRELGGELVSIIGSEENTFVHNITASSTSSEFFIGLNRLDNGIYKWSDRSIVSYVNFQREAVVEDPHSPCVTMMNTGLWRRSNCKKTLGNICKMKATGGLAPNPTTSPNKTVNSGGCPPNFHTSPGASQCYYVLGVNDTADSANFEGAIGACKSLQPGATLASVHSGIDQRLLITLLDGVQSEVLIGLHVNINVSDGLLYEWVDNTKVVQVYWGPYEPRRYPDFKSAIELQCVYMQNGLETAGTWFTGRCDYNTPYVCGHVRDPKFPVAKHHNGGCPLGFQKFRNSCYKYFKLPKTWSDAEKTCAKQNGHIASLHDKYETAYVELLVAKETKSWIGLSYDKTTNQYVWSDGWPVSFTDWDTTSKVYPFKCAVDAFEGGWQTVSCDLKRPFVCEINNDPVPTPVTRAGLCPEWWIPFEEYCYAWFTTNLNSWDDASKSCAPESQLVSIHNPHENLLITTLVMKYGEDAWIGLDRGRSGTFFWTDLSPLDYLNWAEGEESHAWRDIVDDYCVAASYRNNGSWVKRFCTDKLGFVCKLRQRDLGRATIPPHTTHRTTVVSKQTDLSTSSVPATTHGVTKPGLTTNVTHKVGPSSFSPRSTTVDNIDTTVHYINTTVDYINTTVDHSSGAGLSTSSGHGSSGHLFLSSSTQLDHSTTVFPKTNAGNHNTDENSKSKNTDNSEFGGLEPAEKAGIAIGVVAFVILGTAMVYFGRKIYLQSQIRDPVSFENLTYNVGGGKTELQSLTT